MGSFFSDDAIYAGMARYFYEGKWWMLIHPHWRPFFSVVGAVFYLFVRDWLWAMYAVSFVFGSLLVVPMYLIGRELYGKVIGVLVAGLVVFFEPLVEMSTTPLTEALLVFLVWCGVYFTLLAFRDNRRGFGFLSGAIWALAFLTKSEGLLFVAALFVCVVLVVGYNLVCAHYLRSVSKFVELTWPLAKVVLVMAVGFAVVYGPYKALSLRKYGSYSYFSKLFHQMNRTGGPLELSKDGDSTWAQSVWGLETASPERSIHGFPARFNNNLSLLADILISNTIFRVDYYYKTVFMGYFSVWDKWLFLLGMVGVFVAGGKRGGGVMLLVMFVVSFLAMAFFAPTANERYTYSAMPFILVFIGGGLMMIHRLLLRSKWVLLVLVGGYFFYFMIGGSNYLLSGLAFDKDHRGGKTYLQTADEWFLENDVGKRIMTVHEGAGFESRSFVVYPPDTDDVGGLVDYAKKWQVGYIVAAEGELPAALGFLFYEPKDYEGLSLAFDGGNYPLRIYRFTN